jgi:gamma-glutamyltranspeptidase / glutathione hydrolase
MSGAIAAGHPATADAGARVLAEGGNAVDACIAAAFVAFVTEGPLAGPTGGGFLLVHEPGGSTSLLDCFFAVPRRSLGVMEEVVIDFADAGTQTFHVGEGSVALPGLVHGLAEAHRRHASKPWDELVGPAIGLAQEGFVRDEARAFLHEILTEILLRSDAGRRVYGDPPRVHTAELVPTLERIRDVGVEAVAELLPEFADDLAGYEVIDRTPVEATVFTCEVLTTPPPSRGGSIVLQILDALAAAATPDLPAQAHAIGHAYGASAKGLLTGTTHVSVVDGAGTAAGLSMTLGSGSGVFRGGSQLNNMLGELDVIGFEPRPPGERLPSMMAPTLVLDAGRPRLVLGSAGSVRLAGAIAQVIWRVVGEGLPVAAAVDAPRIHVDGSDLHLEGGWPEDAAAALEQAGGWDVVRWSDRNLFFGGVSAVEVRADGARAAAGDPRRGGGGRVVAA